MEWLYLICIPNVTDCEYSLTLTSRQGNFPVFIHTALRGLTLWDDGLSEGEGAGGICSTGMRIGVSNWRALLPARLCYTRPVPEPAKSHSTSALKLLSAYLGLASIDDALRTTRGQRVSGWKYS